MFNHARSEIQRLCLKPALVLAAVLPAVILLAQVSQAAPIHPDWFAQPAKLELDYTWSGLFPMVPKEHFNLLTAKGEQYFVKGRHEERVSGTTKAKPWGVDGVISSTYVKAVFKALDGAEWAPVTEPAQVLDHTDDYPVTSLSFSRAQKQAVKLFTNSNTDTGAPWNLSVDNKLYSSKSTEIGKAVYDLFDKIRELPHKP